MKVSVIVPAHNAAGTLAGTLASLRAQTFVNSENLPAFIAKLGA